MGYCITMNESTIGIKLKNAENIVKALKAYGESENHIPWISNGDLIYSKNLMESMAAIRYPIYINSDKEIFEIGFFNGEKLGDDLKIFEQIATFIEDGYIEYLGEDGSIWRYVFKDGAVKEVHPKIIWE